MQQIAVISLGAMEPGIVARLARGGYSVSAYDKPLIRDRTSVGYAKLFIAPRRALEDGA